MFHLGERVLVKHRFRTKLDEIQRDIIQVIGLKSHLLPPGEWNIVVNDVNVIAQHFGDAIANVSGIEHVHHSHENHIRPLLPNFRACIQLETSYEFRNKLLSLVDRRRRRARRMAGSFARIILLFFGMPSIGYEIAWF